MSKSAQLNQTWYQVCLLYTSRIEAGNKELAEFEAQQNQQTEESDQHEEPVEVEATATTEDDANKESVPVSYTHLDVYKRQPLNYLIVSTVIVIAIRLTGKLVENFLQQKSEEFIQEKI